MSDREVVVDGEAVEAAVVAGEVVVAVREVVVAAGEVVVAVEIMAARETIRGS